MDEGSKRPSTQEELEAWARGQLDGDFAKLDGLAAKFEMLRRQPGSVAETNDRATPYDPISNQVHHFLALSYDHLAMLRNFVLTNGVPAYAWYALVRAAIEASALGLWLLTPGTLNKRVFRSVQFVWDNRLTADQFTKRSGAHTPETTANLRRTLDEIKNHVKGNGQRSLDRPFPSITDIITEAERTVQVPDGMDGLDVWRACSAFAHGNRTFALATLQYKETGNGAENVRDVEVRGNVPNLAMMFNVGMRYFEALIDAQVSSNTTPQGGARSPRGSKASSV